MEHPQGAVFKLYAGPFTLEEYASLIRVPSSSFSGTCPGDRHGDTVYDNLPRPIEVSSLLQFGSKFVKLVLDDDENEACCSASFLFHHLQVPYVPH